jgi:hypothetical protein
MSGVQRLSSGITSTGYINRFSSGSTYYSYAKAVNGLGGLSMAPREVSAKEK